MKRDQFVDFFYVPPQQQEIHKRLENWARACFSGGGSSASPMFRLYRSSDARRESSIPCDQHDAAKIAKGVAILPELHRVALSWNYIDGGSPHKIRQKLGVTFAGLMLLINDGRQMLINREV